MDFKLKKPFSYNIRITCCGDWTQDLLPLLHELPETNYLYTMKTKKFCVGLNFIFWLCVS